jgi:hypothetical protein
LLLSGVYRANDGNCIAPTTMVRVLRRERGVGGKMSEWRIGCFDYIVEEALKMRMVCAGGDRRSLVKRI